MPILIVIIDHFDSFSYNLYQLIASLHREVCVFRCDKVSANEIKELSPDALILSPGPRGPKDTGITQSILNDSYFHRVPIIGVCLGFQTMALSWDIEVSLAPEVVHGKTIEIDKSSHPIFHDLQEKVQVARYHSLCILSESINNSVKIISDYDNMVMIAEDHKKPWIGIQFHPESFLTPDGKKIMENALHYLSNNFG